MFVPLHGNTARSSRRRDGGEGATSASRTTFSTLNFKVNLFYCASERYAQLRDWFLFLFLFLLLFQLLLFCLSFCFASCRVFFCFCFLCHLIFEFFRLIIRSFAELFAAPRPIAKMKADLATYFGIGHKNEPKTKTKSLNVATLSLHWVSIMTSNCKSTAVQGLIWHWEHEIVSIWESIIQFLYGQTKSNGFLQVVCVIDYIYSS